MGGGPGGVGGYRGGIKTPLAEIASKNQESEASPKATKSWKQRFVSFFSPKKSYSPNKKGAAAARQQESKPLEQYKVSKETSPIRVLHQPAPTTGQAYAAILSPADRALQQLQGDSDNSPSLQYLEKYLSTSKNAHSVEQFYESLADKAFESDLDPQVWRQATNLIQGKVAEHKVNALLKQPLSPDQLLRQAAHLKLEYQHTPFSDQVSQLLDQHLPTVDAPPVPQHRRSPQPQRKVDTTRSETPQPQKTNLSPLALKGLTATKRPSVVGLQAQLRSLGSDQTSVKELNTELSSLLKSGRITEPTFNAAAKLTHNKLAEQKLDEIYNDPGIVNKEQAVQDKISYYSSIDVPLLADGLREIHQIRYASSQSTQNAVPAPRQQTTPRLPEQLASKVPQETASQESINQNSDQLFTDLRTASAQLHSAKDLHNATTISGGLRFRNILPPKASEVLVGPKGEEEAINANYVGDFIALQGVMNTSEAGNPRSRDLTFNMFYEQGTNTVVNLTNNKDLKGAGGKSLEVKYWPAEGKSFYVEGGMKVTTKHIEAGADYDVITLQLGGDKSNGYANLSSRPAKEVKIFHFHKWPDHGVPSGKNLEAFQRFNTAIEQHPKTGKVCVHCKAGVGRTGTFIVLDQLKKGIASGEITRENLFTKTTELVYEGRKQRGEQFVQSPQQLKLLLTQGLSILNSSSPAPTSRSQPVTQSSTQGISGEQLLRASQQPKISPDVMAQKFFGSNSETATPYNTIEDFHRDVARLDAYGLQQLAQEFANEVQRNPWRLEDDDWSSAIGEAASYINEIAARQRIPGAASAVSNVFWESGIVTGN
ncbi:tyrosine-protein phosphatase [Spongorhabdus nitratireducens]